MNGSGIRDIPELRRQWRAVLGFHVLMQLAGFALFTPLVTWIARRLVLASGEPVISNFDIAGFVLSPLGLVAVMVVAACTIGLLLAELAGLSWIAGRALVHREATLVGAVAFVVRRLHRLLLLATHVFVRLVLLAAPFLLAVAAIWYATLRGHDINYYLAEHPPEWVRARTLATMLVAGYALLVAWKLARWLLAVPILVFEATTPGAALAQSHQRTRGHLLAIVWPLLQWWLLLTAGAIAVTWASRFVSDAGLDWAGIDVQRVLPLVAVYLVVSTLGGLVYGALGLAGHQAIVTRMYAEQRDPERMRQLAGTDASDVGSRSLVRLAVVTIIVLLLLSLGVASFLGSRLELRDDVAITAHRGASVAAPENSMAAFRAAMEAGATFTELDVQRTRDGQIVVVHDGDLMRLGGDPRKVSELTAAEIAGIDIGRKYDARFAGETPPTLAQVIDLVRGRMKINVELKYNVPDPLLAPAVIELLKSKQFLDDVVITSLDYAALKQVESIEPRVRALHWCGAHTRSGRRFTCGP
jgi:glycerophosphoryl diester phosphodiesterase